jgi:hypothetical protein
MGLRTRDNFKYVDRYSSENSTYKKAKQGPFLFDLNHDFNESYNAETHYPEKMDVLRERLESKREVMKRNPRGWKDNGSR